METTHNSIRDKVYIGMLDEICEQMEMLSNEGVFDKVKAKNLINKYVKLSEKTYGDSSRSKEDLDSWERGFAIAYDAPYTLINSRYLSEVQKENRGVPNWVI